MDPEKLQKVEDFLKDDMLKEASVEVFLEACEKRENRAREVASLFTDKESIEEIMKFVLMVGSNSGELYHALKEKWKAIDET